MDEKQTHPYLKFNSFVLSEHCFDFEVNADCADKGRGEGVVCVTEEEGGLAHAAVAYNQQLEHVVKILVGSIFLPFAVTRRCHLKADKHT